MIDLPLPERMMSDQDWNNAKQWLDDQHGDRVELHYEQFYGPSKPSPIGNSGRFCYIGHYKRDRYYLRFHNDADAILFKMVWSDMIEYYQERD